MAVELVSETFAEHTGETFELTPQGAEPFEVVLSSCEESPYAAEHEQRTADGRIPFSLIFHAADREHFWPQQTFSVSHPELGEVDLFIVPLGPDDRGMQYQAVIS
jgi:hypothetical protein